MKRPWIWLIVLVAMTVLFFDCRKNIQIVETSGAVDNIGRKTAEVIAGKGMLNLVQDSMEHPAVALTFDDGTKQPVYTGTSGWAERKGSKSIFFSGREKYRRKQ